MGATRGAAVSVAQAADLQTLLLEFQVLQTEFSRLQSLATSEMSAPERTAYATQAASIPTVPFYSQFTDIADPRWQKVGCGVASLAMLIDYYKPTVSVETLLRDGRAAGAYLESAGWTHAGLIALAEDYGLTGEAKALYGMSKEAALENLRTVVDEGPVMVSVHYTFDPQNPIPHLAVITGIDNDYVYYNDPAEARGGGKLTHTKFKAAWKQRYIAIRPAA